MILNIYMQTLKKESYVEIPSPNLQNPFRICCLNMFNYLEVEIILKTLTYKQNTTAVQPNDSSLTLFLVFPLHICLFIQVKS